METQMSINSRMDKLSYIHTIENYTGMKMNQVQQYRLTQLESQEHDDE